MKIVRNSLLALASLTLAASSFAGAPVSPPPAPPEPAPAGGFYFSLNGGALWLQDSSAYGVNLDFDTGFSPQPQATPSFESEAPAAPPTTAPAETDTGEGGDDLAADDEIAVPPLVPTASGGEPDHRTVGKAVTYVLLSALAGVVVGGGSRIVRLRSVA